MASQNDSAGSPPAAEPTQIRIQPNTGDTVDGSAVELAEQQAANASDPKQSLEPYDWDTLEQRLYLKQREFAEKERAAFEDFESWMQLFEAWAMAGTEHEDDRARKRLRTRIEHVKGSELKLEEKREHYVKVIEAFSSALKMLK